MKIRHYQGYGTVNAKKIEDRPVYDYCGNEQRKIVIRVNGDHEWGLYIDWLYNAAEWLLVKHFLKMPYSDIAKIANWDVDRDWQKGKDGNEEEVCTYTFIMNK